MSLRPVQPSLTTILVFLSPLSISDSNNASHSEALSVGVIEKAKTSGKPSISMPIIMLIASFSTVSLRNGTYVESINIAK